ncbi:MAG: 4-hydroxythreonine-4-phosphate dehydrogenase PdxA, partial [Pseudomonadota bacterium]
MPSSMPARPPAELPLAVTQGDPCGIGPEIIAKLFGSGAAARGCFVVGDVDVMRRAAGWVGGLLSVAVIAQPADAWRVPPNCIPVWSVPALDALQAPMGQVDARAGASAAACIEAATALALQGEVAG